MYHSVALLLLDGTVLIAGSNPNEMPVLEKDCDESNQYTKFPTDFRTEIWTPPYLRGEKKDERPLNIQLSTTDLNATSTFNMNFTMPKDGLQSMEIILYAGGFVTHSVHMGHVMIYLEHRGWERMENGIHTTTVVMPSNVKLAPGPYVVYVVANGVPGIGQFVTFHT